MLARWLMASLALLGQPVLAAARDDYGKNLPVRLPTPGSEVPARSNDPCEAPILAAERRYAIPTGLLLAIALVETGRPDKSPGRQHAWPWTVNAAGQGLFFPDQKSAIRWVVQAQQSGITSIDVGCLQVNLAAHPTAFRSVQEGFDPALNADFAARFLSSLFQELHDWQAAVGTYHSRTLALAAPYRDQVGRRYAQSDPAERLFVQSVVAQRARLLEQLRLAWSATLTPPALPTAPDDAAPARRSFP